MNNAERGNQFKVEPMRVPDRGRTTGGHDFPIPKPSVDSDKKPVKKSGSWIKPVVFTLAPIIAATGVGLAVRFGKDNGGDHGVGPIIATSDTLKPSGSESSETTQETSESIFTDIIESETSTPTETTKPTTLEPTPTPSPIETTAPTTTETKSELEGVAAERLQFTKDLLNIYDTPNPDEEYIFDKFKEVVTRDQIIEYGKTGQGLTVIENEDKTSGIAFINCNTNVVNKFKDAIKEMRSYDSNYVKFLTSNGMRVLMVNNYDGGGPNFTFNKSGLVVLNANNDICSKNNIITLFKKPISIEAIGIRMYNLGGDYANYVGFMKQILASDIYWNLYKKNNQPFCEASAYSCYSFVENYYNQVYAPVTLSDEKIQNLLKSVRDNNLATPFGGTWSEISKSIADKSDWDPSSLK